MIRRKVVVFHPYYSLTAGSERVILELCDELRDVFEFVFIIPGDGVFTKEVKEAGFEVVILPPPAILDIFGGKYFSYGLLDISRFLLHDVQYNFRIASCLRRRKPDLFVMNTTRGLLLAGLSPRLASVPAVLYHHGHETRGGLKLRVLHLLSVLLPNQVLSVSEDALRQFGFRWILNRKATVIHNWVEESPALHKTTGELFEIGMVGNIVRRKGAHVLVEAIAGLRERPEFKQIHVSIAGEVYDVEYYNEILALIKNHGLEDHITFRGFVKDMDAFYAQIDVFVLPSFREGQPRAILEAMMAEKPIVASTADGVSEMLTHGENALLFPPGDSKLLSEALMLLLEDSKLRARIAANARNRALTGFLKQVQIEKIKEFFFECMGSAHMT